MEYRRLGASGIKLSELSFGSWLTFGDQITNNNSYDLIKYAFDSGVNFFDNAEGYANGESETIMGKAIKDFPRDEIVVATKLFFGTGRLVVNTRGLSRKHLVDGLNASLKRLNLDYVDLLFCHRHDPEVSVEEVVRTMNLFINQGKILYWGTSQWDAKELLEAFEVAERLHLIPPTMEQPQYNLFDRGRVEEELLPVFKKGFGTTIWSPLASGVLTGKYSKNIPENSRLAKVDWLRDRFDSEKLAIAAKFSEICAKRKVLPSQVAIKWCLLNDNVSTVILGASSMEQLKENLDSDKLSNDLVKEIVADSF